jgi:hypothetical protein
MDSAQQSTVKPNIFSFLGKFPLLKILISLALVIVLLLLGWILWYYGYLGEFGKVAAVVDGQKIYKADIDRRYEAKKYFYTNVSKDEKMLKDLKKTVMNEAIESVLLSKFLKEHNLEVKDSEVNTMVSERATYYGSLEKYEKNLSSVYHATLDDVKFTFKNTLMEEKLQGQNDKKYVYGIWVNKDKPLDTFPDPNQKNFKINEKFKPDDANKKAFNKILEAYKALKSGKPFSNVVATYSEDKVSAEGDGYIGLIGSPYVTGTLTEKNTQVTQTEPQISFPSSALVYEAWRNLGESEYALYQYPSGFAILKVRSVRRGLLGVKNFDDWYLGLRSGSNVKIFVKL